MTTQTKVDSSTTTVSGTLGDYIRACATAKAELPTPATREQAEWLMGQFLPKQDGVESIDSQIAALKTERDVQFKHANLFRAQLEQWFKDCGEEVPVELGEGIISLGNKSNAVDKFDEDKLRAFAEKNDLAIFGDVKPAPISNTAVKAVCELVTKGRDAGRFKSNGKLVPGVQLVPSQKIKIERVK